MRFVYLILIALATVSLVMCTENENFRKRKREDAALQRKPTQLILSFPQVLHQILLEHLPLMLIDLINNYSFYKMDFIEHPKVVKEIIFSAIRGFGLNSKEAKLAVDVDDKNVFYMNCKTDQLLTWPLLDYTKNKSCLFQPFDDDCSWKYFDQDKHEGYSVLYVSQSCDSFTSMPCTKFFFQDDNKLLYKELNDRGKTIKNLQSFNFKPHCKNGFVGDAERGLLFTLNDHEDSLRLDQIVFHSTDTELKTRNVTKDIPVKCINGHWGSLKYPLFSVINTPNVDIYLIVEDEKTGRIKGFQRVANIVCKNTAIFKTCLGTPHQSFKRGQQQYYQFVLAIQSDKYILLLQCIPQLSKHKESIEYKLIRQNIDLPKGSIRAMFFRAEDDLLIIVGRQFFIKNNHQQYEVFKKPQVMMEGSTRCFNDPKFHNDLELPYVFVSVRNYLNQKEDLFDVKLSHNGMWLILSFESTLKFIKLCDDLVS